MNDMVVDSIYEDYILLNSEWPYSEQLQHKKSLSELSSDEKLRVMQVLEGVEQQSVNIHYHARKYILQVLIFLIMID